jgi:recombination protein RecR
MLDKLTQELINEIAKLPGIGPKSAQRIAFWVLSANKESIRSLAEKLIEARENIHYCDVCGNFTQLKVCDICTDERRTNATICVVEEAKDITPIEKTREFKGKYHVLGGTICPIENVGPEDLRIRELLERLMKNDVKEVIVATNPTITGEATALYLSRAISPSGIKITRLGLGLPMGSDLEYADEITLGHALESRQVIG